MGPTSTVGTLKTGWTKHQTSSRQYLRRRAGEKYLRHTIDSRIHYLEANEPLNVSSEHYPSLLEPYGHCNNRNCRYLDHSNFTKWSTLLSVAEYGYGWLVLGRTPLWPSCRDAPRHGAPLGTKFEPHHDWRIRARPAPRLALLRALPPSEEFLPSKYDQDELLHAYRTRLAKAAQNRPNKWCGAAGACPVQIR